MGTNLAQAPSVSSDKALSRAVEILIKKIEERQRLLVVSQKEIEDRIDKLFDANKKDQPLMMEYIGLLMDLYVEIKETPIGLFPSLTELGFKYVPTYIQEFFETAITNFELVTTKIMKKKEVVQKRKLDDWEVEAYVTQLPEINSLFGKEDLGYIKISSQYSTRRMHPIHHIFKSHLALDLVDKCPNNHNGKTPLYAPFAGMLSKGQCRGEGCFVTLTDTTSNFSITVCHVRLKEWLLLQEGFIEAGNFMALTGTTGDATGPHGHLETEDDGEKFNPSLVADWCTGIQTTFFLYKKGRDIKQVKQEFTSCQNKKIFCEILDNLTSYNAQVLMGTRR